MTKDIPDWMLKVAEAAASKDTMSQEEYENMINEAADQAKEEGAYE